MLGTLDQSYITLLHNIGNVTWCAYVIVLFVVFWLGLGSTSYYFGTTVLVVCNLLMQIAEPGLVALGKEYPTFIIHIWYTFWAALDAFAVHSIFVLHRRADVRLGFVAKSLAFSFTALCITQVSRYFDRVIFRTDWLGNVYLLSINAINIGCVVVILLPICSAIFQRKAFLK